MISTQAVQKSINIGFIGVGWIGRNRMEVLLKNDQLRATAISEPDPGNATEALKAAPSAFQARSLEEVIGNPEIDAVVIATPSALHARQSIQALRAGKAVFCQKPLGRTAKEVREVVSAARSADKLLGVDLSYRHTKAFGAVHEELTSGSIGDVFAVDLVFHNAYGPDKPWFYQLEQSGGGCVMDLGIHLVDLALWSLDFPEVTSVQSSLYHQGKRLEKNTDQVEDYASVNMNTEKGTQINLQCSWNISAGQDAVIEARFYGTKGGLCFRNLEGSFYDFQAEKYEGTRTEILVSPPDHWSGAAATHWAEKLLENSGYDAKTAEEFIKTSEIIDRIYGR